jgi:hypothetical protein
VVCYQLSRPRNRAISQSASTTLTHPLRSIARRIRLSVTVMQMLRVFRRVFKGLCNQLLRKVFTQIPALKPLRICETDDEPAVNESAGTSALSPPAKQVSCPKENRLLLV